MSQSNLPYRPLILALFREKPRVAKDDHKPSEYAFSASRKTSQGSRAIQKTPASHHITQEATTRHHGEYLSPHLPHAAPPAASYAAVSVPADDTPTRDAVLYKSADDDAADDHPTTGGDDLVTGDGARVDLADSDNDAAGEEDNALATTV